MWYLQVLNQSENHNFDAELSKNSLYFNQPKFLAKAIEKSQILKTNYQDPTTILATNKEIENQIESTPKKAIPNNQTPKPSGTENMLD